MNNEHKVRWLEAQKTVEILSWDSLIGPRHRIVERLAVPAGLGKPKFSFLYNGSWRNRGDGIYILDDGILVLRDFRGVSRVLVATLRLFNALSSLISPRM